MINLIYSMQSADDHVKPPLHAQKQMKKLGITYKLAVPQSMYNSWWFFDCEGVPDQLPPYLRHFGSKWDDAKKAYVPTGEVTNLAKLIGYGLSHHDVEMLEGRT